MLDSRNWAKVYRLSIFEDDSHKKIISYRFSKTRALVTLITAVVVLLGLFYVLVALTPLRTTIPGYPDAHFRKQAVSNAIKIDSLENTIRRWQLYTDHLSRVLAGEEIGSLDSIAKAGPVKYFSSKTREELGRQDTVLRELVAKEEQFGLKSTDARNLPIEGTMFFTPLKGVLTRAFVESVHPYVDISAPANSVVCSASDGTVIFSDWDDEYGYSIVIQHSGNVVTIYRHNEKLLKATGDVVKAGASIALVGSTSSLDLGDHLHFEMWHMGVPVDPAKYMSL